MNCIQVSFGSDHPLTMAFTSLQHIKITCLPLPNAQHLRQIYTKPARKMFPSNKSTSAGKTGKVPRSSNLGSPPKERSDVDCYTCRRRHVKCDRTISSTGCSKCAKKGTPCLGYQKPLRWADGVASRGKLKGKSQPVVDGKYKHSFWLKHLRC